MFVVFRLCAPMSAICANLREATVGGLAANEFD